MQLCLSAALLSLRREYRGRDRRGHCVPHPVDRQSERVRSIEKAVKVQPDASRWQFWDGGGGGGGGGGSVGQGGRRRRTAVADDNKWSIGVYSLVVTEKAPSHQFHDFFFFFFFPVTICFISRYISIQYPYPYII